MRSGECPPTGDAGWSARLADPTQRGRRSTQSIGADLSVTAVPSFLKRALSRRSTVRPERSSPPRAWAGGEGLHRVEVVAPDPECAALFLEYASPLFPVEIVPGTPATVRLQPPTAGARWVIDLLALVERWLEAVPLPCVRLMYGGRSYLVRSSIHVEDLVVVAPSDGAAA